MKRILISLDELLDTRLAMVGVFDPTIVERWVMNDAAEYFRRPTDDILWKSINASKQDWYKAWDKRDVGLLRQSVVTHIPRIMTDIVLAYRESGEHSLGDLETICEVNTYPYQLSEDELSELVKILEESIPIVTSFKLVRYTLEDLTVSFIKSNFDFVFMYEFNRWADKHMSDIKASLITRVHFFVPRLFTALPPDTLLKEDLVKEMFEMDVFKIMEGALSPKIGLTFIPPSDFGPVLTVPQKPRTPVKDLDSVHFPSD